jgi:CRISPR/Cas system-associated endonuclease Cas1
MKPIMVQIQQKHKEIEMIKLSRMAEKMQQEKIAQLTTEIQALEKQAHEIRKKNSKEFERILNKKQKAELETMKAEGRARFEKYHKARTPFQGLGTPNMFLKPLLPPPPQKEGLWK